MGELTFVLGPARSGKSRLAERLAAAYGPCVLYVATLEPLDDEMVQRVADHRAGRPSTWDTLEEPRQLVEHLHEAHGYDALLLDCLTLWTSNLLLSSDPPDPQRVLESVNALLDWQRTAPSPLIAVSNEVGAGIVPAYELGRVYRDVLGRANQLVATAADRFYCVIAGHYLDVKALGARPIEDAGIA